MVTFNILEKNTKNERTNAIHLLKKNHFRLNKK